jgi:hypothetical protein
VLARAGDGEAFFVKKLLDAQNVFHILPPIHALAGAAFDGLELRKLGFPEAQDVRRQAAKARDFANTEIEFLGDQDVGGRSGDGFYARTHFS